MTMYSGDELYDDDVTSGSVSLFRTGEAMRSREEAVERIRSHHDRSVGHVPTNTIGYCGESDGISAVYCEIGVLLAALDRARVTEKP